MFRAITVLLVQKARRKAIHEYLVKSQKQGGDTSHVQKIVKIQFIAIREVTATSSAEQHEVPKESPTPASPIDSSMTNTPWGAWSEADPAQLQIRGPDYLRDRKKIPAGDFMFKLVHNEVFSHHESEGKIDHWASRPDCYLRKLPNRDDFYIVVNWQVPGSPMVNWISYFKDKRLMENLNSEAKEASCVAVFNRTLERFLDGNDNYRHERFKMIPRVVEGNWVVRKGVGTTPAILGTKLHQSYYEEQNYFEIDVDVGSSKVAKKKF